MLPLSVTVGEEEAQPCVPQQLMEEEPAMGEQPALSLELQPHQLPDMEAKEESMEGDGQAPVQAQVSQEQPPEGPLGSPKGMMACPLSPCPVSPLCWRRGCPLPLATC